MDIHPLGHSAFKIKGKTATLVTDPYDPKMTGLKFPKVESCDILLVSHQHSDHNNIAAVKTENTFVIQGPGEYEIKGVFIFGLETDHDDKGGAERGKNTVYRIILDDVKLLHLGDLGRKLSDAEIDKLGDIDILFIPVGGNYTIDAKTAAEVVAQLEPRIVIPMHYGHMNLLPVTDFQKEMGAESVTAQPKLTTSAEKLPETTTVVVLE